MSDGMTFEKYVALASELFATKPSWRFGQALYNTLGMIRPDLADQVVATEIDPFHMDKNITSFMVWVVEHWDDRPNDEAR